MTLSELKKLFLREQAKFAELYPRVGGVGLVVLDESCSPGSPCRRRDLAWYDPKDTTVGLIKRALTYPRSTLTALLRHELGHAADPTPRKRGAEARADQIAWDVTGVPIRYDTAGLQTTGPGGRRPSWLHR